MAGKRGKENTIPECVLKEKNVTLGKYYKKEIVHNTILSWRISKYEELRLGVMYFQLFESVDLKCVLRLFKKEETLCLCVGSSSFPENTPAEFAVLNERNHTQVTVQAKLIEESMFVAEFKNEEFLHCLQGGVLTVTFTFASDCYESKREKVMDETEVLEDVDQLCIDLTTMYLEALYPDFLIHAKNISFKTHKFVLASRTKYFEGLFKTEANVKEDRLPSDHIPGIVHEVLMFIYGGELKEMNIACMLRVYNLAVYLEVPSLKERCLDYFSDRLHESNYKEVCRFASSFSLKELKNRIVRVAKDRLPFVNIVQVFKEIEEGIKTSHTENSSDNKNITE